MAKRFLGGNTRRERLVLLAVFLCFTVFMAYPEFLPAMSSATAGEASIPSLSISPGSPFDIVGVPGQFTRGTQTLSVATTNYTGYTLSMETAGSSTNLVSADTEVVIPTITLPSGRESISQNEFAQPSYGYSTDNLSYKPVPALNESVVLDTSGNSNNGEVRTSTLSFAIQTSPMTPAGTFQNTFTLTATANAASYIVYYNENAGTDTVHNFPANTDAYLSGLTVRLSTKTPTRDDYVFGGWNTEPDGTGTNYDAGATIAIDPETTNTIVLYANWVETLFPYVFQQEGACEFHGNTDSNITGSQCSDYTNAKYIDTGVSLYSTTNYDKDFEIGFTIDSFDPNGQETTDDGQQHTFVNSKLSSSATISGGDAPGLVVRMMTGSSKTLMEVNSKMDGTQLKETVGAAGTAVQSVKVVRVDGVIYYSINGGALHMLQDISEGTQKFDLTTWFGAYPANVDCTANCTQAKRILTGTLSNMYIRMGEYHEGEKVYVTFNGNGGAPQSTVVDVIAGAAITNTPVVQWNGHTFDGWYDENDVPFDSTAPMNEDITYYAHWTEQSEDYVCVAAQELHFETCQRTGAGCGSAGYSIDQRITYGSLVDPNDGLVVGNAFNCDINNDGTFDEITERFYYYGNDSNNAKLIYYKNLTDTNQNYASATAELPDTSSQTWTNTNLVRFDSKVTRFMTYEEGVAACDGTTSGFGSNGKCLYMLEQSNFATEAHVDGWWLGSSNNARVHTASRSISTGSKLNAARPVIEVPLAYISLYPYEEDEYTITFNTHGGSSVAQQVLDPGDEISSSPTTTYAHHLFQGWFDAESGGNQITFPFEPSRSMTLHARWKSDVTLATIGNTDLTFSIGDSVTINVTNAQELEPYTFSSNDTSIVTVDANTGVLTGIGEGTTSIVMTGTTSHETKTLAVEVVQVRYYRVTYNTQGGTATNPAYVDVQQNTTIGSPLPTTSKTDNIFFGWYTDTTYNTEFLPETPVSSDMTVYARWIESTSNYPIVWYEPNACTFNGTNNMTGTYCSSKTVNNNPVKYIDTNIQLFIEANYDKDFEVGFNVVEFDPTAQVSSGAQATFVNSKQENQANNYPGFVFRRYSGNNTYVELTQKWLGNSGATKSDIPASTLKQVRIIRRTVNENGTNKVKIYYSINGSEPVVFQDITSIARLYFDTEVWFGSSANGNGAAWRPLVGTLTDMYIKLGDYSVSNDYTITLEADGGQVNPQSVSITPGDTIGNSLPTPTRGGNYVFDDWYTGPNGTGDKVTSAREPQGNETYYANWTHNSSNTPVSFNVSNEAARDYQTLINSWVQSPVLISTFNKDTSNINNSTWGDTTELAEADFWSGLEDVFETNNCMIPSYEDSAIDSWTGGTVDCSKPDAYDTGVGAAVNVYTYDTTTSTRGANPVTYAKAASGVIHNLIPNQTYYWEKADDNTIYGYITTTSPKNRRLLDTGEVRNVRDLGGLPVTGGGTLKYGRLIRGERLWTSLANASEIANLGVTKEVDLREQDEGTGDVKITDLGNQYKYVKNTVVHYDFNYGTANYQDMRDAVTEIMDDITGVNHENIFFHCRIGSDRTGVIAYLLEGLLGVPDEDRYEEYEITYLSGQVDRTRYYKQKPGNTIKFVYMMDYVKTAGDIYNWYMAGSQDPTGDAALINAFRSEMIE